MKCGFAVSVAALLLYLTCLAPTVTYGGDCGELIAASYRLGIPHPTGYPLYCLLARLFALLVPFGEIGWRYNLFSAVCGAFAAGLLTVTVHFMLDSARATGAESTITRKTSVEKTGIAWASAGSGFLFAGFFYFGSQCVIAEVYALGALLLVALLYCAAVWHQSGDWRYFYAQFLLFGLALNAHLSCLFLVPALLLYSLFALRERFRRPKIGRHLAIAGLMFLIGFSVTLYLPLRARTFAPPSGDILFTWWPLDWGHPVDFSHWLAHITGRQYNHLMGRFPLSQVPDRLAEFFGFVLIQYLWCVFPIAWGAVLAWKKAAFGNLWLGAALLVTFVFNIGTQIRYDVSDLSNFMFPAYVVMAIWLGFGLFRIFSLLGQWSAKQDNKATSSGREPRWVWRTNTLLQLALVGTIIIQWTFFLQNASRRGSTTARDAALERAVALESLQRSSGQSPYMMALSNDTQWAFWYVQYVLGKAAQIRTPWAPNGNAALKQQDMAILVAMMKKEAPVAMSYWDAKVDERFPYVPLTESGNLWLASSEKLPQAATTVKDGNPTKKRPGLNGLFEAKFRRSTLYGENQGRAILKREDLAAFEVDFFPVMPLAKSKKDEIVQNGWAEVLLARRGTLKGTPPPGQIEVRVASSMVPPLRVWKQRRRLIIKNGALPTKLYRAVVPIQIDGEAPTGTYDVWTRIILKRDDRVTAWQQTDTVDFTHR